jgi:hypothetical protein
MKPDQGHIEDCLGHPRSGPAVVQSVVYAVQNSLVGVDDIFLCLCKVALAIRHEGRAIRPIRVNNVEREFLLLVAIPDYCGGILDIGRLVPPGVFGKCPGSAVEIGDAIGKDETSR